MPFTVGGAANMTRNERKLRRGKNETTMMGVGGAQKQNNNNNEKQLFFSFLKFCRHTGSDTNLWYYSCAKNNRATTWIEPAIASNTDDYCGLDIHKLKTSFFGSICGHWLSTKRTRSRFTSVFFRSVSLVFVVWGGRADSNEILSFCSSFYVCF